MLFSITLNLALAVFILGTIYRVVRWFTVKVGPDAGQFTVRTRVLRAFNGLFSVLFSRNIFRLIKVFFIQVIFQGHILKKDPWRWLMHFNIFVGILAATVISRISLPNTLLRFASTTPFLRLMFAHFECPDI